jgi:uncharacterized LabA/DUF88 family protein
VVAPAPPSANLYIDGFNLYYGCLQKTPYKWLDLAALAQRLLPRHTIKRIRYCTARIKGASGQQRQDAYLRALGTLPKVSIHEGTFREHTLLLQVARKPHKKASALLEYRDLRGNWVALPRPVPGRPIRASVRKSEEKASDVNLATYLLLDAMNHDSDEAFVISGDSDLVTPIDETIKTLGIPVGVFNPKPNRPSAELQAVATSYQTLPAALLPGCQFPISLVDTAGRTIRKPTTW